MINCNEQFFYTKNKYIFTFNEEDLIEKDLIDFLQEIHLNECNEVKITLLDTKDIKIKNLFSLTFLKKYLEYKKIKFTLNISDSLKEVLSKYKKLNLINYL